MELMSQIEMTNSQAAELLRNLLNYHVQHIGRGNGKTFTSFRYEVALMKAIDLLEKTGD